LSIYSRDVADGAVTTSVTRISRLAPSSIRVEHAHGLLQRRPVEPLPRLLLLIQARRLSMLLVPLMQRMELIDALELRAAGGGVGLREIDQQSPNP
jgi:hypothetical protein